MFVVRRVACSVVPIFLCLVAAISAAQASESSSAAVPKNLRAQVFSLGRICSKQPAALKHQDCLMVSRVQQKRFVTLYTRAARLCQLLRPSLSDGHVSAVSVERRSQHTS